jgi:hypothetical protein
MIHAETTRPMAIRKNFISFSSSLKTISQFAWLLGAGRGRL